MRIHQAIYGEKSGHALLHGTSDNALLKRISGSTDLIDRPDGGILNAPVIRGFFTEDHFLLIKYFPETSKTARRGRVFSHVLIIEEKDLQTLDNICDLFQFHMDEINKEVDLSSIEFESLAIKSNSNPSHKELIATNSVIQGQDDGTIVWVGDKGYWDWIAKIWSKIPLTTKKNIQIGWAFNPRKIKENKLSMVYIPEEAQTAWSRESTFQVINNVSNEGQNHDLVDWFLTKEDSSEILDKLMSDFEPTLDSISELVTFYDLGEVYNNLDDTPSINELLVFSDYVSRVLPNEKIGRKGKNRLLTKIAELIPSSDKRIIKALYHQSLKGYAKGAHLISSALRNWLNKNLFLTSETNGDVILQALIDKEDNWWCKEVLAFVASELKSESFRNSASIWRWLLSNNQLVEKHQLWLPIEIEDKLFLSVPKIEQDSLEPILKLAKEKKWIRIHANVASRYLETSDAINRQLELDTDQDYYAGIREILKHIKQRDFVNEASKKNDERLFELSAELLIEDPSLVVFFDPISSGGQVIWDKSTSLGNDIWEGISDINQVLENAMDRLIGGTSFNISLLTKISNSNKSSLLNYKNRNTIWNFLPQKAKENFLENTCLDAADQLASGKVKLKDLEHEIQAAFNQNSFVNKIIEGNDITVDSKIRLFEILPSMGEDQLKSLLEGNRFNDIEARTVGQLINVNSWTSTAKFVYQKLNLRSDLLPVLKECYRLLGFFQKIAISDTLNKKDAISDDELWENLEAIIVELYSSYTSLSTLWKKAGGKESDLLSNESAAITWGNALHKLRRNQFAEISTSDLLQEINKSYEHNPKFKAIYKLMKQK